MVNFVFGLLELAAQLDVLTLLNFEKLRVANQGIHVEKRRAVQIVGDAKLAILYDRQ